MKPTVFDSSAVIALLMGEAGAEKVGHRLADAALSSVNLAEVVSYFAKRGASQASIAGLIDPLSIEIVSFDKDLAATTGMLIATARSAGLSLGDCACLALAQGRGADVLTGDRAWLKIGRAAGVDIVLIR
jgi:PIN domain nuclease of toxin-antitoxin system